MLTAAELEGMRATSVSAMPDAVTITRPAARTEGTLNTSTHVWTPAAGTEIYAGVGRLRPPDAQEQTAVFGDTQVTELRYVLTVPYDAGTIRVDDIVTVGDVDDEESSDETISAQAFRVIRVPVGSWHIDRRVGVERVV